jgi:hypothetical protein
VASETASGRFVVAQPERFIDANCGGLLRRLSLAARARMVRRMVYRASRHIATSSVTSTRGRVWTLYRGGWASAEPRSASSDGSYRSSQLIMMSDAERDEHREPSTTLMRITPW